MGCLLAACSSATPTEPDAASGYNVPSLAALADAPDLELLTIEPNDRGWSRGGLSSQHVLGRVALPAGGEGPRVVAALDQALRPDDPQARCFAPRHALRGTTERGVIEVMVCFERHLVDISAPGFSGMVPMANDAVQFPAVKDALESIRRAAGLELAP